MTKIDPTEILSGREAAEVAGIAPSYLRVLLAREQFPEPFRRDPQLWLRHDVHEWAATRKTT
jgi:predicted DNA-binding transcriptional regulator AlpA